MQYEDIFNDDPVKVEAVVELCELSIRLKVLPKMDESDIPYEDIFSDDPEKVKALVELCELSIRMKEVVEERGALPNQ